MSIAGWLMLLMAAEPPPALGPAPQAAAGAYVVRLAGLTIGQTVILTPGAEAPAANSANGFTVHLVVETADEAARAAFVGIDAAVQAAVDGQPVQPQPLPPAAGNLYRLGAAQARPETISIGFFCPIGRRRVLSLFAGELVLKPLGTPQRFEAVDLDGRQRWTGDGGLTVSLDPPPDGRTDLGRPLRVQRSLSPAEWAALADWLAGADGGRIEVWPCPDAAPLRRVDVFVRRRWDAGRPPGQTVDALAEFRRVEPEAFFGRTAWLFPTVTAGAVTGEVLGCPALIELDEHRVTVSVYVTFAGEPPLAGPLAVTVAAANEGERRVPFAFRDVPLP